MSVDSRVYFCSPRYALVSAVVVSASFNRHLMKECLPLPPSKRFADVALGTYFSLRFNAIFFYQLISNRRPFDIMDTFSYHENYVNVK